MNPGLEGIAQGKLFPSSSLLRYGMIMKLRRLQGMQHAKQDVTHAVRETPFDVNYVRSICFMSEPSISIIQSFFRLWK